MPLLLGITGNTARAITVTSVTLNPSVVYGGTYFVVTVTLSGPFPAGSGAFYLSSSNTAIATVPSAIGGAVGDTQETFIVDAASMTGGNPLNVNITVTYAGIPSSATLTIVPYPGSIVSSPTADSFVQSGSAASTNYGSSSYLVVKTASTHPSDGNTRVTYINFDLTGVTTSPSKALLKLNFASSPTPVDRTFPIDVYSLPASTTWSESIITWNNAPNLNTTNTTDVGGTLLTTANVLTQGGVTAIDVTPFVQSHLGQVGTLQIIAHAIYADQNGVVFYSREAAAGTQPTLTILPPISFGIANIVNGASLSGEVPVSILLPNNNYAYGDVTLYVDGNEESLGGDLITGTSNQYNLNLGIETDKYSNGSHTLMVQDSAGHIDWKVVNFNNTVSNIQYDSLFDTVNSDGVGEPASCHITGSLSTPQSWSVTIQSTTDTPSLVRTYNGNSNHIDVTWDGKDNNNIEVDDEIYSITFQVAGYSSQKRRVSKHKIGDAFLLFQTDKSVFPPSGNNNDYKMSIIKKLQPYLAAGHIRKISIIEIKSLDALVKNHAPTKLLNSIMLNWQFHYDCSM